MTNEVRNNFWDKVEPFDIILLTTIILSFVGIMVAGITKDSSLVEASKYILATMIGVYGGRKWSSGGHK